MVLEFLKRFFDKESLVLGASIYLMHELVPGPGIVAALASPIPGIGHVVTVGESMLVGVAAHILIPKLVALV